MSALQERRHISYTCVLVLPGSFPLGHRDPRLLLQIAPSKPVRQEDMDTNTT